MPGLAETTHLWWKKQKRRYKQMRKLAGADVALVSYAKSGRTWLNVMLSQCHHELYGTPRDEIFNYDNLNRLDSRIPKLFFVHDRPWARPTSARAARFYARKKVILLVRDPRDVVVSHYFHMTRRSTAMERAAYGLDDSVVEMPIADYALHPTAGLPRIIDFMNVWAEHIETLPREHLLLTYEQLRAEPEAGLAEAMRFLGQECPPETIAAAVAFGSVENMREKERSGFFQSDRLRPGEAGDEASYKVRRAKIAGYKDYFSDSKILEIDRMLESRLSRYYTYGRAVTAPVTPLS